VASLGVGFDVDGCAEALFKRVAPGLGPFAAPQIAVPGGVLYGKPVSSSMCTAAKTRRRGWKRGRLRCGNVDLQRF
jgi:hypothetical protein